MFQKIDFFRAAAISQNFSQKLQSIIESATIGWEFECPLQADDDTSLEQIKQHLKRIRVPFVHVLNRRILSELGLFYVDSPTAEAAVFELATCELQGVTNSVQALTAIKLLLNLSSQDLGSEEHENTNYETIKFPFIGIGYYDTESKERSTLGCHLNLSHEGLNISSLPQGCLLDLSLGCVLAMAFSPIIPQYAGRDQRTKIPWFYLTLSDRGRDLDRLVSSEAQRSIFKGTQDITIFEKSRQGSLHINIFSPPMSEISHLCLLTTVAAAIASATNGENLFLNLFAETPFYQNCKRANQTELEKSLITFAQKLSLELPMYLIFGHPTSTVKSAIYMLNALASRISSTLEYGRLYQDAVTALIERNFRQCLLVDSLHTALLFSTECSYLHGKPPECVLIPYSVYQDRYTWYFWQSSLPFELVVEHLRLDGESLGITRSSRFGDFFQESYNPYKKALKELGFTVDQLLERRLEGFYTERARNRLQRLSDLQGKSFSWDL